MLIFNAKSTFMRLALPAKFYKNIFFEFFERNIKVKLKLLCAIEEKLMVIIFGIW